MIVFFFIFLGLPLMIGLYITKNENSFVGFRTSTQATINKSLKKYVKTCQECHFKRI